MYELNEHQTAWLEALESGKYSQTRSLLHRKNETADTGYPIGFCCLGVACEVLKDKIGLTVREEVGEWRTAGSYDSEIYSPPTKVQDALKLKAEAVDILIIQNDTRALSFTEIAKYIRDNPNEVWTDANSADSDTGH